MTTDTIPTHPHAVACWADPLSRAERRALAKKLAHAGLLSFTTARAVRLRGEDKLAESMKLVSADCGDLHRDVTERAAFVPPSAGI